MKILTPGHKYGLAHFETGGDGETIQFIEKDAAMNTLNDGTTNEEVLSMLIDRLKFLGEKLPCRENSIAVTKCEEALLWLNKRTQDRRERGVEGTSKM
jgi:hypothetical protein